MFPLPPFTDGFRKKLFEVFPNVGLWNGDNGDE